MVKFLVDLYRALLGIVFAGGLIFAAFAVYAQPDAYGIMVALGVLAGVVIALGLSAAVIRVGDEIEAMKTMIAKATSGTGARTTRSTYEPPDNVVKVFKGQAITREGGGFHVGDRRFGTVLDAEAWISASQSAKREV